MLFVFVSKIWKIYYDFYNQIIHSQILKCIQNWIVLLCNIIIISNFLVFFSLFHLNGQWMGIYARNRLLIDFFGFIFLSDTIIEANSKSKISILNHESILWHFQIDVSYIFHEKGILVYETAVEGNFSANACHRHSTSVYRHTWVCVRLDVNFKVKSVVLLVILISKYSRYIIYMCVSVLLTMCLFVF